MEKLLWEAVQKRQLEVVKLLVAAGTSTNFDISRAGLPPWTLLREAIKQEDVEIVKVLVKAGANINAKVDDETPLQRARINGNAAIVQVLLEAGAKPLP